MSARAELQQIIARLEVISHVPAVNLDPTPPETTDGKGEVGRFAADLIARRFPNGGTNDG